MSDHWAEDLSQGVRGASGVSVPGVGEPRRFTGCPTFAAHSSSFHSCLEKSVGAAGGVSLKFKLNQISTYFLNKSRDVWDVLGNFERIQGEFREMLVSLNKVSSASYTCLAFSGPVLFL